MDEPNPLSGVEAENRLLRRVIETITSSVELEAVLRSTVDLVTEATGGDACFLFLWDAESERLTLRAASRPFQEAVGVVRLRLGEGVTGWVAAHREVVAIPEDKWADPRYKYIPELKGEIFTSMLSVPVVSPSETLIGVVNIHSRERREFADRDIEFLRLTASLIAQAIEHADLFTALARKEAALEALMRRTIDAQEEERRRVAAEIHDGVTQQLVSIWYRLQAGGRSLRHDPDGAEQELAVAEDLVDQALSEARAAIYDLRPSILDDLGLSPSLRTLALQQLPEEVEVDLHVDEVDSLPPYREVALYRIVQEAVNNIRKHAQARRVTLALHDDGTHIQLRIEDDGRGFEVGRPRTAGPQTAFGLTGMAERASLIGGRLSVQSEPGRGTTLTVRLPKRELEAQP